MLEVRLSQPRRGFRVEVEFTLEEGGALALFGPSGAGKSTVLACIAGFQQPAAGVIRLGGRQFFPPPLPLHRRGVGMLTQEPALFPHCTVEGNVAFGLPRPHSVEARAWLARLREQMHLGDCWHAPATRISAGQARRVALARMLAPRPALVLLDEPFGGLDRGLVRGLLEDFLTWRRELGFTLIAVDHQAEVLEQLCPRVLAMAAGRVVASGSWAELRQRAPQAMAALLAPL
ncbi:MAG TPA: ATP-binding cassette domain-containing protein [Terriglobales bacterium]|jgi:ABC-type sulfate/molybdate transport systems ATPase subunit